MASLKNVWNRGRHATGLFPMLICCMAICCEPGQEALAETQTIGVQSIEAPPVVLNEGERALDLGEYARAETLFLNQIKNAGKNDGNRGYLQLGLSEALLNQGRINEAAKEYKKAQSLLADQSKPDELTARLYDGMSWLYHAQGKLDDAVDYAQKAMSTRNSLSNPSTFMMVNTLTHLGAIMEAKGNLSQACQYYQQALGLQDSSAGPGTLLAADLQEDIGSAMRRLGETDGANECYKAALQIKLAREGPLSEYAPKPYWENISFPFVDGSQNCMKRFEQGTLQEIITANGVTIGASLKPVESSKTTEVSIIVRNDSNKNVQFLPIAPSLTVTAPKIYLAPQVDPTKLAETIQKKGDRKASWIRFWGNQATQTMTSTCIGQPGFMGYPPVYGGYGGYSYGSGNYHQWYNRSGDMTIMNTSVPNYAAQARAYQRAEEVSTQAHQNAATINSSGLGPSTLPPGKTLSGSLFFDAPKITQGALRIPVGNAMFEFQFPPK